MDKPYFDSLGMFLLHNQGKIGSYRNSLSNSVLALGSNGCRSIRKKVGAWVAAPWGIIGLLSRKMAPWRRRIAACHVHIHYILIEDKIVSLIRMRDQGHYRKWCQQTREWDICIYVAYLYRVYNIFRFQFLLTIYWQNK